jgi:hypothetical protein
MLANKHIKMGIISSTYICLHNTYAPGPIKVKYFDTKRSIHTDQKIRVANITMNHPSIMKGVKASEEFVTEVLMLFVVC